MFSNGIFWERVEWIISKCIYSENSAVITVYIVECQNIKLIKKIPKYLLAKTTYLYLRCRNVTLLMYDGIIYFDKGKTVYVLLHRDENKIYE